MESVYSVGGFWGREDSLSKAVVVGCCVSSSEVPVVLAPRWVMLWTQTPLQSHLQGHGERGAYVGVMKLSLEGPQDKMR